MKEEIVAAGKLPSETRLFTEEDIPNLAWRECYRASLTIARELTEEDYKIMSGIIETLEGEAAFKPGDYIAIGATGELYPIPKDTMESAKEKVSDPDEDGFSEYQSTKTVKAIQIEESFATMRDKSRLDGKSGDFLLYEEKGDGGVRMWIVNQDLFSQTYEFINEG